MSPSFTGIIGLRYINLHEAVHLTETSTTQVLGWKTTTSNNPSRNVPPRIAGLRVANDITSTPNAHTILGSGLIRWGESFFGAQFAL